MNRLLVVGLLAVVVSCTSALAVTINGDISDWAWYNVWTDPVDNAGGVELTRYGCFVESGYMYVFYEITQDIDYMCSYTGTTSRKLYAGNWIDVDNSTGTFAYDQSPTKGRHWVNYPTTGARTHDGHDILGELGLKGEGLGPPWPPTQDFQYWGSNGDIDVSEDPMTDATSAYAWTTHILEMKYSLAEMQARLDEQPAHGQGQIGLVMKAGVAIQGVDRGTITYGYDLTLQLVQKQIGDFDADGTWESEDMDALHAAVDAAVTSTPTALSIYDNDHDGDVDMTDQQAVLDDQGSWKGDANCDGKVTDLDAGKLGLNWQAATPTVGGESWGAGDFNNDGIVNDLDAGSLGLNWQKGVPPGVPEPATLTLLALGGIALIRRRK